MTSGKRGVASNRLQQRRLRSRRNQKAKNCVRFQPPETKERHFLQKVLCKVCLGQGRIDEVLEP